MIVAYDKLEREMNDLKHNIGRRVNPSDTEAMRAWRERMRSTKERTLEDIEQRASQLEEVAKRIRDRTYEGARVINIAPIAETSANNYDAGLGRVETEVQADSTDRRISNETRKPEPEKKIKEEVKTKKAVKVKKVKKETAEGKPKRKESQKKSRKSARKSRESSST